MSFLDTLIVLFYLLTYMAIVAVVVYTGKLWTSPEILRENFPPPRGTQRGDVYSFSVIAFEIMMRSEPYSFDHMTARGLFVGLRYVGYTTILVY